VEIALRGKSEEQRHNIKSEKTNEGSGKTAALAKITSIRKETTTSPKEEPKRGEKYLRPVKLTKNRKQHNSKEHHQARVHIQR